MSFLQPYSIPANNPSESPVMLALSGHDPCGGAGIQADIETGTEFGIRVLALISCLTVQDSGNVYQYQPLDPEWLEAQWTTLRADIDFQICKVGLLGSSSIAKWLAKKKDLPPLVLDPVLTAGGGAKLANNGLTSILCQRLLPRTWLLTPNLPEAQALSGQLTAEDCAQSLCDMGCASVLITGGHDTGNEVINRLFNANGLVADWAWPRLPLGYHGSGCTLASACAALLAKGIPLPMAVEQAQSFTWQTLLNARQIGRHQAFPLRHFANP